MGTGLILVCEPGHVPVSILKIKRTDRKAHTSAASHPHLHASLGAFPPYPPELSTQMCRKNGKSTDKVFSTQ